MILGKWYSYRSYALRGNGSWGALRRVFDDSTQSVHPVRPYAERRNDGKDYL